MNHEILLDRISCWETSQGGKKKEEREKNHYGLCTPSAGHSWHTFHSPGIAGLSSTPRWHFLCYFTLLLSKNRVLTCLILTSSLASPPPVYMPNWLPRILELMVMIDNDSKWHLRLTSLVPVSVLSSLGGPFPFNLPKSHEEDDIIVPVLWIKNIAIILFSLSYSLIVLKYSLMDPGVMTWEGIQVLLEVTLWTDTTALSPTYCPKRRCFILLPSS